MHRKLISSLILLLFGGFVTVLAPSSWAAGYKILEQSGEGVGVSFSGSATGYGDGSEVFFNPAAMGRISETQTSASLHTIITSADFTDTGSSLPLALGGTPLIGGDGPDGGDTNFVPNIYMTHPIREDLTVGLGVNAPFGLASEYDTTWVGRYHAVKSELTTINVTPGVAYRFKDNVWLGASFHAMYLDAELSNAIDFGTIGVGALGLPTASALGLLPQAADGLGVVEGDDWGYGYTLGMLVTFGNNNAHTIGMSYHSKVDATLSGDATFTVPTAALPLTGTGAFTNTGAQAGVTLPESLTIGYSYTADPEWEFLMEAEMTRWSRFEELRIQYDSVQPDTVTPEEWNNAWRVSLGSRYRSSEYLTWLFGVAYDESPITSDEFRTPRIPGNDRYWVSVGAKYAFCDNIDASLSYAHLFIDDASSVHLNGTGSSFVGDWDLGVDIISAGVSYRF